MNPSTPTNTAAWYAMLSAGARPPARPLPPIAPFDPQGADEPPADYGLRALLYVLANDHAIGIPDRALELAQYAAPIATSHADISPIAAGNIARAVSQIGAALRARAALVAEFEQDTPPNAPGAPAGRDKPNQGPGAPLSPQPTPRPPQGSQAQPPAAPLVTPPAPQPIATRTAPAAVLTRADFDF